MTEAIKIVRISAATVWSLILGILSLLYFGIFAGIPGIICGHTARSKIRQSQGATTIVIDIFRIRRYFKQQLKDLIFNNRI